MVSMFLKAILTILNMFLRLCIIPIAVFFILMAVIGCCVIYQSVRFYRHGFRIVRLNRHPVVEHSFWHKLFFDFPYMLMYDMTHRAPDQFCYSGLIIFTGRQGYVKTIAATHFIRSVHEEFPLAKCITNYEYSGQDARLNTWRMLLSYVNGKKGVIVGMDELLNWFSSKMSADFPPEMLEVITQNRKNRRIIVGTSQNFSSAAKDIRKQATEVRECITLFGCITIVHRKVAQLNAEGDVEQCHNRGWYWFDYKQKKFLHNIDTFYYSVKLSQNFTKRSTDSSVTAFREYFDKLEPDEHNFNVPLDFGQEVQLNYISMSFAGFYDICIECPEYFDIFMASSVPAVAAFCEESVTSEILVQIRSCLLWELGAVKAYEYSFNVVKTICDYFNFDILEVKENRIDYCWHTNYLQNPETYFRIDNLTEMAVTRLGRSNKERGNSVSYHYSMQPGRTYENDYIALGKRGDKCFLRIYLKSKEVVQMGYKPWFFKVWLFHNTEIGSMPLKPRPQSSRRYTIIDNLTGEVVDLKLEHIRPGYVLIFDGKFNKSRHVPLQEWLNSALCRLTDTDSGTGLNLQYVFLDRYQKNQITDNSIKQLFRI